MQLAVRIIEAYVPGLNERPADWFDRLESNVAAALAGERLRAVLLAIPADETLMWLVWGPLDQRDPGPAAAAVIVRETHGDGAAVIERAIDARFVWDRIEPGQHDRR